VDENGNVNRNALRLRLTDTYLDTLKKVYSEVKLVGLPSASSKGGSGGLEAEALATAIVLSNHVGGATGGNSGSGQTVVSGAGASPENVNAL